MFSWIDGHIILAMIVCPMLATLIVGLVNEHRSGGE